MTTLTYSDLGDGADQLIGQPLGSDFTGWPQRVIGVRRCLHADRYVTHVEVEPWPLPAPGDRQAAIELSAARLALDNGGRAEIASGDR